MLQDLYQRHDVDADGNPAGGVSVARGITVAWQAGPLAVDVAPEECIVPGHQWVDGAGDPHDWPSTIENHGPCRRAPNGAFVEDVIGVAIGRLEAYQDSRFECEENAEALRHLWSALEALQSRTAKREAQGVEGTHRAHTDE